MNSSASQSSNPSARKDALNQRRKPALSLSSDKCHRDSGLSSKTPEKLTSLPRRIRNKSVALSVKEIREAAKCHRDSGQKSSDLAENKLRAASGKKSARKKIALWPDESPADESKKVAEEPIRLPEKYEMLCQFFNSLDCSIRLLRLKGSASTFTNICPKVESLTDRRFSHHHLAQLKFILPEVILMKKVLSLDERTSCMKPDIHIMLEAAAIENDGKLKSANGNLHLRKVFRSRVLDFFKAHPEADEIPEESLPEPFNLPKKGLHSIKSSSSSLLTEASTSAASEQQPATASHLSRSFQRHFSCKTPSNEPNLFQKQPVDSLQPSLPQVAEPCPRKSSHHVKAIVSTPSPATFSLKSNTEASSSTSLIQSCPVTTPIKAVSSTKNGGILATPVKAESTPAKLMIATPALQSPKRCRMSPDDISGELPNKLVRRTIHTRSLKFDTPVKKSTDAAGCSSVGSDILDILPESLLQSIKSKEQLAVEEQDVAISQAKRRREIIAGLPKLLNVIHFLFQSIKRSVITKEELLHKVIAGHSDILDRRELEEQLHVLQELAPEWISEKTSAISGDLLFCVNKASNIEVIRSRLAEAI